MRGGVKGHMEELKRGAQEAAARARLGLYHDYANDSTLSLSLKKYKSKVRFQQYSGTSLIWVIHLSGHMFGK